MMSTESAYTTCYKKNLFEFRFYTHFFMFFHMYIALGQGQTTLCHKILMSTERPCHFAHLLCKFKKNIFEVLFYTYFCVFLYTYIAPGQV